MRLLLIGATGYVGSRVRHALGSVSGIDVVGASRHRTGGVQFDLTDPASFAELDGFDIVVNCADSLTAPPDQIIDYCCSKPVLFIETTADANTIDRISRNTKSRSGVIVLGMGLFPGLSNILARTLCEPDLPGGSLEIGVHFNLLSGAGAGTCRLMAESAQHPISNGIVMPFWKSNRIALRTVLPEAKMLQKSAGISNVATYISPSPAIARFPMLALGTFLRGRSATPAWFKTSTWLGCLLLRGYLLARRTTTVEIAAGVGRAKTGYQKAAVLRVNDGMLATAHAIAAAVDCLRNRKPSAPGVFMPDELLSMSEILEAMKKIPGPLTIELRQNR